MDRDTSWKQVWNDRDDDRADWNGYESCFPSLQEYLSWVDRVSAFITEVLSIGASDEVADLGCGSGRMAESIARTARAVTAIDYSRPAIDLARRIRPSANITYSVADLNSFDVSSLQGCTKAYSVGSFMYLTSVDHVVELLRALVDQGISVLALDLPDSEVRDDRERPYDRDRYSHLAFTAVEMQAAFPGSQILRGMFPEYVNDEVRFALYIPADLPV